MRVTIGIPTYRRPQLLRRAVLSALAQDHTEVEVVVSDNGSADETAAICREMAAADPRLRFLEQPVNLGPGPNFLAVLSVATGEFFMWLGDDDWIDPSYVSTCLRILCASDDIAIVGGVAKNYRSGQLTGTSKAMNLVHDRPSRRIVDYYVSVEDNAIFYGVARTSTIRSCVLTNTLGGDWILMAQVAFRGKIHTTTEAIVHRERADSTARSIKQIVQTLRLPRMQELWPTSSIAVAAMRDVLRTDVVFDELSRPARRALASTIGAIILVRVGLWMPLRRLAIPVLGQQRATRWRTTAARVVTRTRSHRTNPADPSG